MDSGYRIDITVFVPYDPKNLDSTTAAIDQAKELSTREGLRKIADTVEIEKVSITPIRDRKPKQAKKTAPAQGQSAGAAPPLGAGAMAAG